MYPVFLASCIYQAVCQAHDESLNYFKSELPCKLLANKYLTIRDIESADRKVKLQIDNSNAPPGKKHKVSYVTYTAEERVSIRRYSAQQLHLGTSQRN